MDGFRSRKGDTMQIEVMDRKDIGLSRSPLHRVLQQPRRRLLVRGNCQTAYPAMLVSPSQQFFLTFQTTKLY